MRLTINDYFCIDELKIEIQNENETKTENKNKIHSQYTRKKEI